MPSLDENLQNWSEDWDWSTRGDEWSEWWGGTPALWYGAVLPRIHAIVPTGTILEIAPGYGRFTAYLKDLCDRLEIVDLTARCIEHCRQRFADQTNIGYHVNDGRSLAMIEDRSVDFAFSFDSLVHVGPEVLDAYLRQLADKLTADGIGFVHHSNFASVKRTHALTAWIPWRAREPLIRRGVAVNVAAWRDQNVSATTFASLCERAGLRCIGQELISWEHGGYLIDCLSMFTLPGSRWDRELRRVRNPLFVAEARRMARLYARPQTT